MDLRVERDGEGVEEESWEKLKEPGLSILYKPDIPPPRPHLLGYIAYSSL